MNKTKLISILFLFYALLITSSSFADIYIRSYTYNASEADSKLTCRTIALDQVKLLLLQELGTHIRHNLSIRKNNSGLNFSQENIESLSSGFTSIEIISEKWDGKTYQLKAKLEANPDDVLDSIKKYSYVHSDFQSKLKEMNDDLNIARKTIGKLRNKLESTTSNKDKKIVGSQYTKEVNKLTLNNIFKKAWLLDLNGEYIYASELYLKAAKQGHVDSQFNLAVLYDIGQGVEKNRQKAMYWFRKAAEQGDKQAINLLSRRANN